jgi:vacuolar-type H+-ATPase subunit H
VGGVILADLTFWKLWLAARFTAPECAPVCCDANHPLPFASGTFSFVMIADAFPYIWHKRLVADARHQATGIVAEARGVAEKERALAIEKTKQEQDELLARARREIAAERDRAVADLRREAVDLSLAAASKLVGSRLDTETDRRIVSEYLLTLDAPA